MSALDGLRMLVLRRIRLTDPYDLAFAKIAQGAIVRNTTFPSGWKSPDRALKIRGDCLVPWEGAHEHR